MSASDNCGNGVITFLSFSLKTFTAAASPEAIMAELLRIQLWSHSRLYLSATPRSAGPVILASSL